MTRLITIYCQPYQKIFQRAPKTTIFINQKQLDDGLTLDHVACLHQDVPKIYNYMLGTMLSCIKSMDQIDADVDDLNIDYETLLQLPYDQEKWLS